MSAWGEPMSAWCQRALVVDLPNGETEELRCMNQCSDGLDDCTIVDRESHRATLRWLS